MTQRARPGRSRCAPLLIWALLCGITVSCTPTTSVADPSGAPRATATSGSQTPADGSVWATEIKDAAASASSELERAILADGTITAAEVAEARGAYGSCMAAYGAQVTWEPDNDGYSVGFPDAGSTGSGAPSPDDAARQQKQMAQCFAASPMNAVSLYYQIRRNPQKQDEFAIIAACFVRKGVMPPGYTGADFARDRASNPKPTQFDTSDAGACFISPLAP